MGIYSNISFDSMIYTPHNLSNSMRGMVICEVYDDSCGYIWKNRSVTDIVWEINISREFISGDSYKFVQERIKMGSLSNLSNKNVGSSMYANVCRLN